MCVNNNIDINRQKCHMCNNNFDTLVEDKNYLQKFSAQIIIPLNLLGHLLGHLFGHLLGHNLEFDN